MPMRSAYTKTVLTCEPNNKRATTGLAKTKKAQRSRTKTPTVRLRLSEELIHRSPIAPELDT